jgi:hypothetical protein
MNSIAPTGVILTEGEEMATAAEFKAFAMANYKIEETESGLLRMTYRFPDDRTQLVLIEVNDDFAMVSSAFASLEDVSPKQALDAAGDRIFGVKLIGNTFYLRHVIPLADVDPSEIDTGFEILAAAADVVEENLLGTDNY